MALSYTQLVGAKSVDGSLRHWLNYAPLPAESILTQAQAFIYERLRAREMRIEAAVTIAQGVGHIDVPEDFLDPVQLLLDGDGAPIDYVHENMLGRLRDENGALMEGTLTRYAIVNEKIMFSTASDADRTGSLWYYAIPAELAASTNETNFLTRRYPSLLLGACKAYAYEFRDWPERQATQLQLVGEGIETANVAADQSRRGQTMR